MEDIGQRIKQLIEAENTTVAALAGMIGATPVGLSRNITGENHPKYTTIMNIVEQFPNVNLEWLMRGEGPMYKGEKPSLAPTPMAPTGDNDLFTQNYINPPVPADDLKNRKDLGVKPAQNSPKPSKNQALINEISTSSDIDKIVIFFKNKTYITLRPEE